MGTRADFYIGTGKNAEWLGSVAYDGYRFEKQADCPIRRATSEAEYRAAVLQMLTSRDDGTLPEDGWPWPWEDSRLTDYAYYFEHGRVQWDTGQKMRNDWPDMRARMKVALSHRSGLLTLRAR